MFIPKIYYPQISADFHAFRHKTSFFDVNIASLVSLVSGNVTPADNEGSLYICKNKRENVDQFHQPTGPKWKCTCACNLAIKLHSTSPTRVDFINIFTSSFYARVSPKHKNSVQPSVSFTLLDLRE
jgi:hypothetical protein